MKWRSIAFSSVVGLLGLAASSSASTIVGNVNMEGSFIYDTRGAGTGLAVIDFDPVGSGTGSVLQLPGMSGYFAGVGGGCVGTCLPGDGLTAGTSATVKDLTNDASAAPPNSLFPFPGTGFLANWIGTFLDPDGAGLHFDLTGILGPTGPACTALMGVGDFCVEGPLALIQTINGMHLQIDFVGNFVNGPDSGLYKGSFASTLNGLTFAELENRLDNTGQDLKCGANNLTDGCVYDMSFEPLVVPEPASLLTFGTGVALLALARRRRTTKANKA